MAPEKAPMIPKSCGLLPTVSPSSLRRSEKSASRAASGSCVKSHKARIRAGSLEARDKAPSAASEEAAAIRATDSPRSNEATTCCHLLVCGSLPSRFMTHRGWKPNRAGCSSSSRPGDPFRSGRRAAQTNLNPAPMVLQPRLFVGFHPPLIGNRSVKTPGQAAAR